MYTIRIANELWDGPIWTLDENGLFTEDLLLIKNDKIICELRKKIGNMWDSYTEFDSHNQACWFNEKLFLEEFLLLLELIEKLKNRLNEINDGSYTVEDIETEILHNLIYKIKNKENNE